MVHAIMLIGMDTLLMDVQRYQSIQTFLWGN